MKRREFVAGLAGVALATRLSRVQAEPKAAGPMVLGGHIGPISSVAFSPDGHWVVSSAAQLNAESTYIGGETRLWDVRAGKLERVLLPDIEGQRMQWSRDGRTLALPGMHWDNGGGGTPVMQLWDASDADAGKWAARHTLKEANAAAISTLSPDGKYFLGGLQNRESNGAAVWDVESGEMLARLGEQSGFLVSAAFAPDGRSLFTASWRGSVDKFGGTSLQWWDTSGAPGDWELMRVQQVPERIFDSALSPNGKTLLWVRLADDFKSAHASTCRPDPISESVFIRGVSVSIHGLFLKAREHIFHAQRLLHLVAPRLQLDFARGFGCFADDHVQRNPEQLGLGEFGAWALVALIPQHVQATRA